MRIRPLAILFACFLISAHAHAARITVTVPADTPRDADIFVAGPTGGDWKPDLIRLTRSADGTYVADVGLPTSFKITRGTWATVEKAADGGEIANRSLPADAIGEVAVAVARWADTGGGPTSRPSTVVGDLRIVSVGEGDAKRTLRVWLPPGHDAGDARYPVLYMHDGQNLFDAATSAFGSEWQVDESLTKLIADKTIEPIIVVGIDNAGARRIDEYTVTQDKGRGGQGEAYERFVVETVKPFIDRTYRTEPTRAHTFVAGSSLGGLISLDMVRRYPDVFGGAIALSPSLWWDDEALTRTFERERPPRPAPTILLTMGEREGDDPVARQQYVRQARRLAKRIATNLMTEELGEHNDATWARVFPGQISLLLVTTPR